MKLTRSSNLTLLTVIMIFAAGCMDRENTGNTYYDQLFEHKVPVKELLQGTMKQYGLSSFNITHTSLSEGRLVGIIDGLDVKPGNYYYFLMNLNTPEDVKVFANPFKQLNSYALSITQAKGKIFVTGVEKENLLYSYDPVTAEKDTFDIGSFNIGDPVFITVYNNNLFAYGSVYGTCIYALSKGKTSCFKHNTGVASHYYSTLSFPLSAGFNLVSGSKAGGDTITVYRVDSSQNVLSQFGVAGSINQGVFKMLAFNNGYAIANEREIIFMDKPAAKEQWYLKLDLVIEDVIRISASELLVVATTLADGRFGQVFLQKIDVLSGTVVWKVPVGNAYYKGKHIALAKGNRIVVTDQANIVIINAANGKVLEKHPHHAAEKVSFSLLTDEASGKNYYFNDGSILYW